MMTKREIKRRLDAGFTVAKEHGLMSPCVRILSDGTLEVLDGSALAPQNAEQRKVDDEFTRRAARRERA